MIICLDELDAHLQAEILSLMSGLQFTPNMRDLLEESVKDLGATIIIISDSNSVFIEHILKVNKLDHLVDKVFTNPASWTEDGKLVIQPYHHQVVGGLSYAFYNFIINRKPALYLPKICARV